MPLYQDSIEKEVAYIVDHAEARFAVVEDQEPVANSWAVARPMPRAPPVIAAILPVRRMGTPPPARGRGAPGAPQRAGRPPVDGAKRRVEAPDAGEARRERDR